MSVPIIGTASRVDAVITASREACRAYFDFHKKFQSHRAIFSKDVSEKSEIVEQANIEMVTAMFNLQVALGELDKAKGN